MTAVASFQVHLTRSLDRDGCVVGPLPEWLQGQPRALLPLHRAMVFNRAFDQKAVALQRTGQLGTYAPNLGHEAIGAALGAAMRPEDVLVPYYRDIGAQLARGVRPVEILQYWSGDERSMNFAACRHDFPICIPIASQCTLAAGVAAALAYRQQRAAAVCTLGDGATSKGDFYEAVNAAGALRLPLIFVISNNGWAISLPLAQQTACATLAQKAFAGGIAARQVDGNDVVAVRLALEDALTAARERREAAVIECLTYRLSDHTTADDATRYRDKAEVAARWADEPIARTRAYLRREAGWTAADEAALAAEATAAAQAAADEYLALPPPGPGQMFDHLYAQLPPALAAQRADLERHWNTGGSHHG